jgi:hypothetical protein
MLLSYLELNILLSIIAKILRFLKAKDVQTGYTSFKNQQQYIQRRCRHIGDHL